MRTVATFAEARAEAAGVVGLVPTMGYLHEGHLSLVEAARRECDTIVVSVFVNPLQFDDPDDLARYPRDPDRDARLAADAGADLVLVPAEAEMYPEPPRTLVRVRGLVDRLEGERRPGHFDGVATVVTKLLAGVRPDRAYFGRKDAQQLAVVRRLVRDLSFPVEIIGLPTVREPDGLALSSRNVRLADREAALTLSRGLFAAADAAEAGERDARVLERLALAPMEAHPGVVPEYAALVGRDDVEPLDRLDRPAFLAVAARVGPVRLIDNVFLAPVDRGVILAGPSILYREV